MRASNRSCILLCAVAAITPALCSRSGTGQQSAADTGQKNRAVQPAAPSNAQPEADTRRNVHVEMRNVIFRDDPASVMRIRYYSGSLIPTRQGVPPSLDDKHSFHLGIDSAVIVMTPQDMTSLLNGSMFNYEGAPLRNISISTTGNQLKMNGTLDKGVPVPMEMIGDPGRKNSYSREQNQSPPYAREGPDEGFPYRG
jgi:hypothetical protein